MSHFIWRSALMFQIQNQLFLLNILLFLRKNYFHWYGQYFEIHYGRFLSHAGLKSTQRCFSNSKSLKLIRPFGA